MQVVLYAVKPIADGAEAELYFEISDGENTERRKFTVTAEMFFELGFPQNLCGNVEISCGKLDEVMVMAEKTDAIKKGLSILSFADNTKKSLVRKLMQKGFSRVSAESAADFLEESGYINEMASAELLARDIAVKKLYGPRRICSALYEKGFAKEAVDGALDSLDVDFAYLCAKRIKAMGGVQIFADRAKKQKAVAALLRYGYSYDDIKEAVKQSR